MKIVNLLAKPSRLSLMNTWTLRIKKNLYLFEQKLIIQFLFAKQRM